MWQSAPVAAPGDRLVSFRVRLGPTLWLGPDSPLGVLARSLVVWTDGKPVWWRRTVLPLAAKPPYSLMSNAVGSSTLEPIFQGRLISASRKPLSIAWQKGPFSALELQLGGRGEGREPLVATGVSGRSDTLAIEWLENGRARLVYDHWGGRFRASDPFDWADSALRSVRIEMPSFGALDHAGRSDGESRLIARVDGVAVWDTEVPFFGAASDSVSIGRNSTGCSPMAAELRSVVVDIHQVLRD
jgi:hypothetical protein